MDSSRPAGDAMVDGVRTSLADAVLPLTDDGVARGDGAFETVGVWGGQPFRLPDHLTRLAASLDALALPQVDLDRLAEEAATLLADVHADAVLRIYLTGSGTRILTVSPQPVRPDPTVLDLQPAPWISPPGTWPAGGAKSMSYAFNMAATRRARAAGADDALLHTTPTLEHPGRLVLEGPTFGVVVVVDDVLHVPAVELGIVDSISRRTLVEVAEDEGLQVRATHLGVEALANASELVACSSVRDAIAVRRVGPWALPGSTPVRDVLSRGLARRRRTGGIG